jgi:choline-sulfatase
MRLPGKIRANHSEDECLVATGLDLMATCCDYAGVTQPSQCKGISLRGVAEAKANAQTRDHVYGENIVSHMIVTHDWKYLSYDGGANAEQLYDLRNDPGETRNFAGEAKHAQVLATLRAELAQEKAVHAKLALGPVSAQQARE